MGELELSSFVEARMERCAYGMCHRGLIGIPRLIYGKVACGFLVFYEYCELENIAPLFISSGTMTETSIRPPVGLRGMYRYLGFTPFFLPDLTQVEFFWVCWVFACLG